MSLDMLFNYLECFTAVIYMLAINVTLAQELPQRLKGCVGGFIEVFHTDQA